MKFFALILAVFTLGLTMYPCDDELFVSSVGETAVHDREHNGHEHKNGEDYCSPFCVCAISIDLKDTPELEDEIIIQIDENPKFVYLDPVTLESTNNIFQPPQNIA